MKCHSILFISLVKLMMVENNEDHHHSYEFSSLAKAEFIFCDYNFLLFKEVLLGLVKINAKFNHFGAGSK